MNLKNYSILSLFLFFTSCISITNNVEDLKPMEDYSTDNIKIDDKKIVDAEIVFKNNQSVKAKLRAETNLFEKTHIIETSINKNLVIYDHKGKKNLISYEIIKKMTLVDYNNTTRTFINRGGNFTSLQEIIYDGKIKWYKEYYAHLYDQSIQVNNYFIPENNKEIKVGNLNTMKNKLKELTSSKPELKSQINDLDVYNTNEIIGILSDFDK